MEDKIYIMTNFNKFTINKINNRINKLKKILYWFIFITFIINTGIISFLVINNFSNKKIKLSELYNENLSEIKNDLYKRISNLQKNIKVNETTLLNTILNQSNENKPLYEKLAFNQQNKILDEGLIFNQTINDGYIKEQINFCNNNSFYNKEFEDRIKLVEVDILYKRYNMYVYKELDYVSNSIIRNKRWEISETSLLMKAL